MTDHIVVFEGNERLVGQTVAVRVLEATSFTLFGEVVTGEQIGVGAERAAAPTATVAPTADRRINLPLI
jgi:tRNA-2-methylthio-N6-dimethylallyladenosine synthase